jgi:hypothetical protein
MQKTVITLQGISDTGKTQTIRKIREILIKTYPNHQEQFLIDKYDIKTIITITLADGTIITVGIESQGDPDSRLVHERLVDFIECDIVICACRTKGDPVAAVCEFSKNNGFEVVWTKSAYSIKHQNLLQQLSAEYILSIFKHIVKS